MVYRRRSGRSRYCISLEDRGTYAWNVAEFELAPIRHKEGNFGGKSAEAGQIFKRKQRLTESFRIPQSHQNTKKLVRRAPERAYDGRDAAARDDVADAAGAAAVGRGIHQLRRPRQPRDGGAADSGRAPPVVD